MVTRCVNINQFQMLRGGWLKVKKVKGPASFKVVYWQSAGLDISLVQMELVTCVWAGLMSAKGLNSQKYIFVVEQVQNL